MLEKRMEPDHEFGEHHLYGIRAVEVLRPGQSA